MNLTCILFGMIFIVAGVLFAMGKLHTRMNVWKNMPDEEKEKINIMPLCRNIGMVIILCGVIFLLNGFLSQLLSGFFVWAMIVWLIVAGFDVWHISKSKLYRNK